MTKRFGRGQRAKLKKLQERADAYEKLHIEQAQEIQRLRFQMDDAAAHGFKLFMAQDKRMEAYLDRISMELGRALGKELEPHAQKLLEAAARRPTLTARLDHFAADEGTVVVVTGVIPQLNYRVVVR